MSLRTGAGTEMGPFQYDIGECQKCNAEMVKK